MLAVEAAGGGAVIPRPYMLRNTSIPERYRYVTVWHFPASGEYRTVIINSMVNLTLDEIKKQSEETFLDIAERYVPFQGLMGTGGETMQVQLAERWK